MGGGQSLRAAAGAHGSRILVRRHIPQQQFDGCDLLVFPRRVG
jgi:hypothetical protein